MEPTVDRLGLARLGGVVCLTTLGLTASFVGAVALASGEIAGLARRLPIYAVAAAVVFVGCVVVLDSARMQGLNALVTATVAAAATLFVGGLGVEGVRFAREHPSLVFEPTLVGYALSAALIGTGVANWVWRNWDPLRVGADGDGL
ncbi:MAG: hypothetical protein ACOCSD_05145 [Halolamina sp.]